MSKKLDGGLGLTGDYDLGEMDWHESMNENLATLNDIEQSHFVSVNGQEETGNFYNDGARGVDSIAIGRFALAETMEDPEEDAGNIAIGSCSTSYKKFSIALGYGSNGVGVSSIAIGTAATTSQMCSIAIGTAATTLQECSIAIGESSSCPNSNLVGGIAIGKDAVSTFDRGVSIGYQSASAIDYSIAIGAESLTELPIADTTAFLQNPVVSEVLSVGASQVEFPILRRVQNVAEGADDNDVVIVAQLRHVYHDLLTRIEALE